MPGKAENGSDYCNHVGNCFTSVGKSWMKMVEWQILDMYYFINSVLLNKKKIQNECDLVFEKINPMKIKQCNFIDCKTNIMILLRKKID